MTIEAAAMMPFRFGLGGVPFSLIISNPNIVKETVRSSPSCVGAASFGAKSLKELSVPSECFQPITYLPLTGLITVELPSVSSVVLQMLRGET